jgi:exonuclease III
MKIATWNLERLDKRKTKEILDILIKLNADIIVLTETNDAIQIDNYNCIATSPLPRFYDNIQYKDGENRVSILTKFNVIKQHETFDNFTSVCADILTPFGSLTVYGSIIGVFANKQPRFDNDLNGQIADIENLARDRDFCMAGDFNVTFSGRPWPSKKARQLLNETFEKLGLTNTTQNITDTVDHIVLSKSLIETKHLQIETWNNDKKLSDHVGHCVTMTN